MKIAAITITYNDAYKLNEWVENFKYYKDEIYLHIIIDNSSVPEYLAQVEQEFPKATIIKRKSNGGSTIAYNEAIKFALADKAVDAVMLIGNDVKIETGDTHKLYDALFLDNKIGMIAPSLLKKDSNIIESIGCFVGYFMVLKEPKVGNPIETNRTGNFYCDAVAGGMNMSTREFYEQVGLQDENIFMYSDEVDMGLRAKKAGFKMAVATNCTAWHQHINPPGQKTRNHYAPYLSARNKVYLANKHFGILRAIMVFFYFLIIFVGASLKSKLDVELIAHYWYYVRGAVNGLIKNMVIPKGLLQ